MKIRQINEYFDTVFPRELSESWDNDGIMVCTDPECEATRVLTTLDVTDEAIDCAIKNGCDLIISHHPLIFKPLPRIDTSIIPSRVCRLLEKHISVMSYHTRFDSAEEGINAQIAKLFELSEVTKFAGSSGSLGRIGKLSKELSPCELANKASQIFGEPVILYSSDKIINKIGIVSGGGWEFAKEAVYLGADAFITGEITYNLALDLVSMGYTSIDAGHYPTEILCDDIFKRQLISLGIKEDSIFTFRHKNPAKIVEFQ